MMDPDIFCYGSPYASDVHITLSILAYSWLVNISMGDYFATT